jgi:hypothetical protein
MVLDTAADDDAAVDDRVSRIDGRGAAGLSL